MQDHDIENENEKPLDPEMEKVRRKMVRLLSVSLGIMFIGVMAVLAAVVYKINSGADDEAELQSQSVQQSVEAASLQAKFEVILPVGLKIRSIDLDDARAAIYGVTAENQSKLFIVDLASGEIISDILLRH